MNTKLTRSEAEAVLQAARTKPVGFKYHATERMIERNVTRAMVLDAIKDGKLLGWNRSRFEDGVEFALVSDVHRFRIVIAVTAKVVNVVTVYPVTNEDGSLKYAPVSVPQSRDRAGRRVLWPVA